MRTLACLLALEICGIPAAFGEIGHVNQVAHRATIEDGMIVAYRQQVKPPDPNTRTVPTLEPIADAPWEKTVIEQSAGWATVLGWSDLDGDGSDELIAAGTEIAMYKRMPGGAWRKTSLASETAAVRDLVTEDRNADGLPDLVATTASGSRVFPNELKPAWKRHVIATGYANQTVVGADFTGDGRTDVISTDSQGKRTILYVAPRWRAVTLQSRVTAIHSEVMDVDGDGDPDYIGARYSPGFIFWLERPDDPLTQPWPFHVVDDSAAGGVHGIHGVITGDVDRNGTLDLIANSAQPKGAFPNSLAWFSIPSNPRQSERWDRHIFANGDAPGLTHYHGFGDVNGDGKPDIASAAKVPPDGNWFAWWEQPDNPRAAWRKHVIATNESGATNIHVVDVNGDGKNDFLCSRGHGAGLVWYEAPNWKAHQINTRLVGPHSLAIGDIDGDGDPDAVTCAKDSHTAAWFENDGSGRFTTHHIHENQASYDIRLVDMDSDGDLDVLNAGQESRNVVWFENRLKR